MWGVVETTVGLLVENYDSGWLQMVPLMSFTVDLITPVWSSVFREQNTAL